MNKKITTSVLAALMIAGTTSFSAFASMASGTVVIGAKAYDLEYANTAANISEINTQVVAGGTIYIKDFEGKWFNNATGLAVDASVIPAVTYKNATGETSYDAGDQDADTSTGGGGGGGSTAKTVKITDASGKTVVLPITLKSNDTVKSLYSKLKAATITPAQKTKIKTNANTELARLNTTKNTAGVSLLQLAINDADAAKDTELSDAFKAYLSTGKSDALINYAQDNSFTQLLNTFNAATGGEGVIPTLQGDTQVFAAVTLDGVTVTKKAGDVLNLKDVEDAIGINEKTTLKQLEKMSFDIKIVTGSGINDASGTTYQIKADEGTFTIKTPMESKTITLK